MLLTFNSILYLILTIFSICQCIGTYAAPFCIFATVGQCTMVLVHLACIILTGVFRLSSEGEACANDSVAVAGSDWTFKEHGTMIETLFICQCVLFGFYNCFCFGACFCGDRRKK